MPGLLALTRGFYFKLALYVGGQHAAVDLIRRDALTYGSPVVAIADGTLVANPLDHLSGWNVYIQHADGWRSGYRHFRELIFPPNVGIAVRQGQVIGFADSTGTVTGPHLHFDLWNRQRLSPEAFFKVGWWAHDPMLWLGVDEPDPPDDQEFLMGLTQVEQEAMRDTLAMLRPWVSPGPGGDFYDWNHQLIAGLPERLNVVSNQVSGVAGQVTSVQGALQTMAAENVQLKAFVQQLLRDTFTGAYRLGSGGTRYLVILQPDGGFVYRKIPNAATLLRMGGIETNLIEISAVELSKMTQGPDVPNLA